MSKSNTLKKDYAKILYTRERLTQKEVAERTGVSVQTITKWVNDPKEEWKSLRRSYSVTKESQLQNIYIQMEALNDDIAHRTEGHKYATPSEADTLVKLASAAKQLETEASITEIINTFSEFIDWLRKHDLDKAKEIIELQDAFVKTKLS